MSTLSAPQIEKIPYAVAPGRPLYWIIVPSNRMLKGELANRWQQEVIDRVYRDFDVGFLGEIVLILQFVSGRSRLEAGV